LIRIPSIGGSLGSCHFPSGIICRCVFFSFRANSEPVLEVDAKIVNCLTRSFSVTRAWTVAAKAPECQKLDQRGAVGRKFGKERWASKLNLLQVVDLNRCAPPYRV
jgi:hypothetical protein